MKASRSVLFRKVFFPHDVRLSCATLMTRLFCLSECVPDWLEGFLRAIDLAAGMDNNR